MHKYVSEFVKTKLQFAAIDPLFEESWKDFQSVRDRKDAMVIWEEG